MFQTRFYASVWAVILILTTTLLLAPSAEEEKKMPETLSETLKVGMIAPDFTLKDEENVERSLSDLLGKRNVVLAFYPKDFTGG